MKTSNRVICKNEVFIEGVSVGEFESFTMRSDYRALGDTATLTIPFYSLTVDKKSGVITDRIRAKLEEAKVNTCAEVDVYCWYDGYDRTIVFHGFVEHVSKGFPTKLYLRDASMMLRFGTIDKNFDGKATLQSIARDCVDIANKGFEEQRKKLGFTRKIPPLKYSESGSKNNNVQATTTPVSFDNFANGRAPYEVINYLMQQLVLYGGVDNNNNLFIGAGVKDSTRPIIDLDTRYNVIDREITPQNSAFVDYDVKITGILEDGTRWTAIGGVDTQALEGNKQTPPKRNGESYRAFSSNNTKAGLQASADATLEKLKGGHTKGTITTLMYPKCQLLDHVQYTDTIFEENSKLYYVIGYSFSASVKGYFQKLTVTDQIFAL